MRLWSDTRKLISYWRFWHLDQILIDITAAGPCITSKQLLLIRRSSIWVHGYIIEVVNKVVQKSCRSTDRIKSNKLMTSLSISLDMLMTGGIIIRVRTRQFRSLHVSAKSEERKNYRRVNNLNGGSDFCRTRGSSLWQFRSTKKLQGRIWSKYAESA